MVGMSDGMLIAADAVAIAVLAFGLYYRRHRRPDMVLAIVSINVGVLAVATVLSRSDVTAGLGLGLFGVLSIIRLRSNELDQEEVAYYFSALALGLIGGVSVSPDWVAPVLMATILVAFAVVDHPRLFAGSRRQVITLDRAIADESTLRGELADLLHADIHRVKVQRLDLVNDSTLVDVRYRVVAEQVP